MNDSMLSYALDYAKKGLAVFPLRVHDKAPMITNGFKKATTDEMQIETWWRKWPNANIGIATGRPSGGVCIFYVIAYMQFVSHTKIMFHKALPTHLLVPAPC